jgi:1-phosphofructokinase family hexose kinase
VIDPRSGGLIERLVCVCPNPSIDKLAVVDRLIVGEIHRPRLLVSRPGGKAINAARVASRLGLRSSVVSILGGHAGAWIDDELAALGLPSRSIPVAGETRTCLSILDESSGQLTEVYEPGPAIDAGGWASLEAAVSAEVQTSPARCLVAIAGSLPPGAPADGYPRLVRLANSLGARVAVDVGGSQLAAALEERPWLVKVNAEEAAAAVGLPPSTDDDDVRAAAVALLRAGANVALVSRGAAGAVLATGDRTWRIGPAPAVGRYGVGSGDALLAGFAVGIASGADLAAAARYGSAVAAAHAQVPGQGELDPADVERLLPLIEVRAFA